MAASDGQEKTEDATPKRRAEARKRGQVAKSQELNGAAVLLALTMTLPAATSMLGTGFLTAFKAGLSQIPVDMNGAALQRYGMTILQPTLAGLFLIFAAIMLTGVTVNVAQVGFLFSAEAIKPSLAKLNPLEGFKRLFSAKSAVEGLKTVAKSTLFGFLVYQVIRARWDDLIGLAWVSPGAAAGLVGQVLYAVLIRISAVWFVLAALDYFFQKKQMDKQLKMSKDELKQEYKEMEGSPELKGERMRRGRKLARQKLNETVPTADVIITNPTHFAIAIQYSRSKMHAPVVVAKGQDYMALKIRQIARESKVPIVPNPKLARALYKQCEIGDFVPRELFQAVAEVLAYVFSALKTVKKRA